MAKTLKIDLVKTFNDGKFDAPILVLDSITSTLHGVASKFENCIKEAAKVDPSSLKSGVSVIHTTEHPSSRLIVSVTGQLNHDYDDARRVYEASGEAINKAVKMGLRNPLLMLGPLCSITDDPEWAKFPHVVRTMMLGAYNALYTPLEVREYALTEFGKQRDIHATKADSIGFYNDPEYGHNLEKITHEAWCIEEGKRVARDIGGSDPVRMAGKKIAEYLEAEYANSLVKMVSTPVLESEYPLAAAVNRGSKSNESLDGRIVKLEYLPENNAPARNVFLVGKGITYDTGGHDLKVGGIMPLMHRDKCGAGVVAGLFKTISLMKPANIRFVGRLACIRNCIGTDAYVSDEIITARSGVRVRVNNTDAEGRMVMADLLGEMGEEAVKCEDSFIFTIATLTGHAMNTYGEGYGAIVANRAGRYHKLDMELQRNGELVSDMFEVSRIRREDWKAHVATDDYADLTNSFAVRGKVYRGHQSPAVFMMQAAGLDKLMEPAGCSFEDKKHPSRTLRYTHLDIAGPEVKSCPNPPTAAGLAMLAKYFLF